MKVSIKSKKYENDRIILKDINLTFNNNGMIFVLGESGSGKSTLLNIIGLLDFKYDGYIECANNMIDNDSINTNEYLKRYLGFIFQELNLINSLSVRENIFLSVDLANNFMNENSYNDIMRVLHIEHLDQRIVETLSGGEKHCIGDNITISTASGINMNCKIVGIKQNAKSKSEGEIYISKDLADYFAQKLIDQPRLTSIIEYNNTKISLLNKINIISSQEEIIVGRNITNSNETVISLEGANVILNSMGYNKLSIEDFKDNDIPYIVQDKLLNKQVILTGSVDKTELDTITIVGIYNNKYNEGILSYSITSELRNKIAKGFYNKVDVYLSKLTDKNINDLTSIGEKSNYKVEQVYGSLGEVLNSKLSIVLFAFTLFSLIVLIITVVTIDFSTKISILDRKYEIGVLKSLGCSNKFILQLFLYENFLIGFFTSFTSVVLLFLVDISNIITFNGIELYDLNIIHYLIIFLVGIFVNILAGLKESIKTSKIPIIQAINDKYK